MAGAAKTGNWRGWFLLALLLTPIAAFFWGVHQEDWRFAIPGAACFAALMTYFVRMGRKTPRDPQAEARFAKARTEIEARSGADTKAGVIGHLISLPIILGFLVFNGWWRQHGGGFAQASLGEKIAIGVILLATMFAALQIFNLLRRRRA